MSTNKIIEIENVEDLTIEQYNDPEMNLSFNNLNSEGFLYNEDTNEIGIKIKIYYYDTERNIYELKLWGESLGSVYENYRHLLYTLLSLHENNRIIEAKGDFPCNPLFREWSTKASERNITKTEQLYSKFKNAKSIEEIIKSIPCKTNYLKIEEEPVSSIMKVNNDESKNREYPMDDLFKDYTVQESVMSISEEINKTVFFVSFHPSRELHKELLKKYILKDYRIFSNLLDNADEPNYFNNMGIAFVGISYFVLHEALNYDCGWLISFLSALSELSEQGVVNILTKGNEGLLNVATYKKEELSIQRREAAIESLYKNYKDLLPKSSLQPEDVKKAIFGLEVYRSGGLVLRNVDSKKEIVNESLEYVDRLLSTWLTNLKEDAVMPTPSDPIFQIMKYPNMCPEFPILLKKKMPRFIDWWKFEKPVSPHKEVLAYYTREDEEFAKGPHIVLSPELIEEASEQSSIPFSILFAIVLVHELSHAIMDKYRIMTTKGITETDIKANLPETIEAKAMEESLANCITLRCFNEHAHEHLLYARHFINNWQPTFYRFGLWQEKIDADWREWKKSTKNNVGLKEWLTECFAEWRVDWGIRVPIEEYTKEIYNKVFE